MTFLAACPEQQFSKEIVVLPNIIADGIIRDHCYQKNIELTDDQHNWFCNFADWRVRWFYANNKSWKKELKQEDPRDFLISWITHWAKAFLLNPENFIRQARQECTQSPDPEWKPGGMLA